MKYTKKIQITEPAMVDLGARNPLSMVHGLAFGMGCNWRFLVGGHVPQPTRPGERLYF
jgi:hypothetical protein